MVTLSVYQTSNRIRMNADVNQDLSEMVFVGVMVRCHRNYVLFLLSKHTSIDVTFILS